MKLGVSSRTLSLWETDRVYPASRLAAFITTSEIGKSANRNKGKWKETPILVVWPREQYGLSTLSADSRKKGATAPSSRVKARIFRRWRIKSSPQTRRLRPTNISRIGSESMASNGNNSGTNNSVFSTTGFVGATGRGRRLRWHRRSRSLTATIHTHIALPHIFRQTRAIWFS